MPLLQRDCMCSNALTALDCVAILAFAGGILPQTLVQPILLLYSFSKTSINATYKRRCGNSWCLVMAMQEFKGMLLASVGKTVEVYSLRALPPTPPPHHQSTASLAREGRRRMSAYDVHHSEHVLHTLCYLQPKSHRFLEPLT